MKKTLRKFVQEERMYMYEDVMELLDKEKDEGLTEREYAELNAMRAKLEVLEEVHAICSARQKY